MNEKMITRQDAVRAYRLLIKEGKVSPEDIFSSPQLGVIGPSTDIHKRVSNSVQSALHLNPFPSLKP